jgi:hypothetical protein
MPPWLHAHELLERGLAHVLITGPDGSRYRPPDFSRLLNAEDGSAVHSLVTGDCSGKDIVAAPPQLN